MPLFCCCYAHSGFTMVRVCLSAAGIQFNDQLGEVPAFMIHLFTKSKNNIVRYQRPYVKRIKYGSIKMTLKFKFKLNFYHNAVTCNAIITDVRN